MGDVIDLRERRNERERARSAEAAIRRQLAHLGKLGVHVSFGKHDPDDDGGRAA